MGTETAISVLLAAGLVAVFGISIKYFKMVNLIAGYDPDKVTDSEELADFVGTNVLYIAGLTTIVGVVEYTQPFDGYQGIWIGYLISVGILTVRIVRGGRRYEVSQ